VGKLKEEIFLDGKLSENSHIVFHGRELNDNSEVLSCIGITPGSTVRIVHMTMANTLGYY
jgi:hypothetical protein